MTQDFAYPDEVASAAIQRALDARGCHRCEFAYLEAPKRTSHICAHPEMVRRFDVTTFIKRKETPKRCPREAR